MTAATASSAGSAVSSARPKPHRTLRSWIEPARDFLRWFYRYRSIRPTPDGVRFLVLTFGIGIAAINTGNNLLYLLLAMMLSLIVISGVLSEQMLKRIEIARRLPADAFAHRPAAAAFVVGNGHRRLPLFSLHIADVPAGGAGTTGTQLLHVLPRGLVRAPYTVQYARRGRHALEGVKITTRFPFGLIAKSASLPLPADVIVYPELRPLPPDLFRELSAIGREHAAARRGTGSGLYNLREYQVGDDARAIHWKTTARQAHLIVRESEAEDDRTATLALPTARPAVLHTEAHEPADQAFEEAVSLTASLADYFARKHYRIRLVAGPHEVSAGAGAEHLRLVFRALALCEPTDADVGAAAFRSVVEDARGGALTLLILPWEDTRLTGVMRSVSRVLGPGVGGPR
jgi:uncharacterized protein (DUF58 family)